MMMKREVTQSWYDYKLRELDDLSAEIGRLEEEKKVLAEDGVDDENPLYGYHTQQLAAAYERRESLKRDLNGVKIVAAERTNDDTFCEYAKSVTLRCVYPDEDEPEVETLKIGHGHGYTLSPESNLFKFLVGKKVGFKSLFTNQTHESSFTYEVEILAIEF